MMVQIIVSVFIEMYNIYSSVKIISNFLIFLIFPSGLYSIRDDFVFLTYVLLGKSKFMKKVK